MVKRNTVQSENERMKLMIDQTIAQIFHQRDREFEETEGPGSRAKAEVHVVRSILDEMSASAHDETVSYLRANLRYCDPEISNLPKDERKPFRDEWTKIRWSCSTMNLLPILTVAERVRNREEKPIMRRAFDDFCALVVMDALHNSGQESNTPPRSLIVHLFSNPTLVEFAETFGKQLGDIRVRNKKVIQPAIRLLAATAQEMDDRGDTEAGDYLRAFQKFMLAISQFGEDSGSDDFLSESMNEWILLRETTSITSASAAYHRVMAHRDSAKSEAIRNLLTVHLQFLKPDETDQARKRETRPIPAEARSAIRGLVKLLGAAAFKTFDRVHFILDRELPDGAKTVDFIELARLCTLTGPAFYDRVAELKNAHFKMRNTKADTRPPESKAKEDPLRRIRRDDEIWNAVWECTFANATKRAKKMAETQAEWRKEGYTDEEIRNMTETVEREVDDRRKDRGEE